jgi:DNA-3-methyladenine glycosylase
MTLVRAEGNDLMSGRIVEVEAYRGSTDPASHAYRGRTSRNSVMFGEPGRAYLYFSYGNHWMLNITTEKVGTPGAVLIRAIEPIEGVQLMKGNRSVDEIEELASGPGKLTQALKIDGSLNGEDLTTSKRLFVVEGDSDRLNVRTSARIGVSVGLNYRWRYFVNGSRFVSRGRPRQPESAKKTHNYLCER